MTEPFGLTLIEAAACGLPIVATEDGGPIDIVGNCDNGLLVDPLDRTAIADALLEVLSEGPKWEHFAASGIAGVRKHYSWPAHVEKYLGIIRPLIEHTETIARRCRIAVPSSIATGPSSPIWTRDLLGDPVSLATLMDLLHRHRREVSFGIATGRSLKSALAVMRKQGSASRACSSRASARKSTTSRA